MNGNVGIGYYQFSDKYGYYSSACIAPFNPDATSSFNLCIGNSASISANGYGTLSWYSAASGGTYLSAGSTFNTGALINTTTYYVQDSTCAASPRTAVTVSINPLPTIAMSGNTSYCSGDSTTLSVSGNGDGFEWSTGSLANTEQFNPTVTTPYWVSTYDGSGCTDTIFFSITVNQIQNTSQTVNICSGDVYMVGNNSYSAPGVYIDSLSSAAGCDSIVQTTITVQSPIDTSMNYTSGVLSSNETGATYQWINCANGQAINAATSSSYTPTQNGTYAVYIVNGPCADTSTCYTVTDVGVGAIETTMNDLIIAQSGSDRAIHTTITGNFAVAEITVFNALGESVTNGRINMGGEFVWRVEATGVYFVQGNVGGEIILKRVVVR